MASVHKATTRAREGASAGAGNAVDPLLANPLSDFRILRELGRSGMGVIYESDAAFGTTRRAQGAPLRRRLR